MGFMDKAKRLAEQAQQKLEEAQTQMNASHPVPPAQSAPPAGAPPVQYDQHGRPIAAESPAGPGPVAGAPDRPRAEPPAPAMPSPSPAMPDQSPAMPGPAPVAAERGLDVPHDRNTVDYTPPQVTSGDPLAG